MRLPLMKYFAPSLMRLLSMKNLTALDQRAMGKFGNQNKEPSKRGKILWVACDSFDRPSDENPGKTMLETVATPNLDALCQLSDTGLMTADNGAHFFSAEKFGDLTHLRSLAITNRTAHCVLEKTFEFDRYESARGLRGVEDALETHWDSFDFIYVHLDGEYKTVLDFCDPKVSEWIEMVDAWLPGLLGRFQPEVFALSGDLDAVLSQDASILAMIHSPLSRAHPCEGLTKRACRNGRLGEKIDLRQWLLLLMAHSSRRESFYALTELYCR